MKDIAASVLSRLLNISKENKEDYQSLLIRFIAERFLSRLGKSSYRDEFILKGAYLLTLTLENMNYRSTKDIDFLKTGATDIDFLIKAFIEICSIEDKSDGVIFDSDTITLRENREQNTYNGQRVKIIAYIGKTRTTLQIDIGIGDSVYPAPCSIEIPSLLDLDTASISSYHIYTVIAEKLEAIISLSLITSRMKDFYDIYIIISNLKLEYAALKESISRTFHNRGTTIPTQLPLVLSTTVINDKTKQMQWKAFLSNIRQEQTDLDFEKVVKLISDFFSVFLNSQNANIYTSWSADKGWS
ncbi:MAG: nucleotidyl transferase AbiEii/AbiGii toxin family protein [Spirochaetaceae bacterium]|nr:nucleotidyl transferase AbiEii/AbiGii toxin family protein [Spirochaetaceae bacterium]